MLLSLTGASQLQVIGSLTTELPLTIAGSNSLLSVTGTFTALAPLIVSGGGVVKAGQNLPLDVPLTVTNGGLVEVLGTVTSSLPLTVDGGTLSGSHIVAPAVSVVHGGVLSSPTSTATQMYKLEVNGHDDRHHQRRNCNI